MKRTIFIIILTLCALIISIGCGGGGIIQSGNTTGSPENTTETQLYGKLLINIKWPEPGMDGSYIISSENSNTTLTGSMPIGSKIIKVWIYDFEMQSYLLAKGEAAAPQGAIEIKVPIVTTQQPAPDPNSLLPSVKVLIKVIAYNSGEKILSSPPEIPYQLEVGLNSINFDLGDSYLKLISDDIVLEDYPIPSSETITTSQLTAGINEGIITAALFTHYPDPTPTPTNTPVPTPTVFIPREEPVSQESSENTLQSQGITVLGGFDVKFTLIQGYGTLITEYGTSGQTVTVPTDELGFCHIKARTYSWYDLCVKAETQLDPSDPTSKITTIYYVPVLGTYGVKPSSDKQTLTIGESATSIATIVAAYDKWGIPGKPEKYLEGREVFFKIVSPSPSLSTLSKSQDITDVNGKARTIFTLGETGYVWISMTFYPEGGPSLTGWQVWVPRGWPVPTNPPSGRELNENQISTLEILNSDVIDYPAQGLEEENPELP